jgi:hypothetical protein
MYIGTVEKGLPQEVSRSHSNEVIHEGLNNL